MDQLHAILILLTTKTRFPFVQHVVDLHTKVDSPAYLKADPTRDIAAAFPMLEQTGTPTKIDILKSWPTNLHSSMDDSQVSALQCMLQHRISICQGPPGTGKTFVSVQALKIMLADMTRGDAPIIIACQTNHALDQLLRHVAVFEPEAFVRLGGRSEDKGVIKARTLYEVRQTYPKPHNSRKGQRIRQIKSLGRSIKEHLLPFEKHADLPSHTYFKGLGLLTEAQCTSLEDYAADWVHSDERPSPLKAWLGKQLVRTNTRGKPTLDFGSFEEVELDFEELKEQEAEAATQDDDEFERLRGDFITLGDTWTGGGGHSLRDVGSLLASTNLWKIPPARRGAVYRYLVDRAKEKIATEVKALARQYTVAVQECKIAGWEQDADILRQQKVIGLTTTGFSKYRGLIASVQPKIVMIEEAAEVLEAPVVACCVESVQHLILVGDHQQLRPHCHVRELAEEHNLNVSLFERLVRNGVEYSVLCRQRRMIPQIRQLLRPIYQDLIHDHASVSDPAHRPPVPGVGSPTHFFHHEFPEQQDDQMSTFNRGEAEMMTGFVRYLTFNGMKGKQITILTFYQGQRRMIIKCLRAEPELASSLVGLRLVTVDSYQGEENEVVILSLVRNNAHRRIGFLGVRNRVCVALSRAQRGLYIFGNGKLLAGGSEVWAEVIGIMQKQMTGRDWRKLPLVCQNHRNTTFVKGSLDYFLAKGIC